LLSSWAFHVDLPGDNDRAKVEYKVQDVGVIMIEQDMGSKRFERNMGRSNFDKCDGKFDYNLTT